ncbi:hypothetical protein Purlil1_3676 [Purpureocillium lilacinum]|uniref:Uncharacterized protein n=1 Tax=Purpureocillium lilacinum TaxID=33203 RepID=A0ABR0C666_PURLI|nr:hypothetical protein Purlil1_3676 [Purpureocillium lilacinum]
MVRAAAGVEESIGALLRATGPSCAVAATSRRRWMVVVGECLEAYVRTHVRLPGGWMGGWLNGGASGGLDGGCPGGPLMGWLGGGHLRRAQPSACTSSFVQVLAAGSAAASTRRRRRRRISGPEVRAFPVASRFLSARARQGTRLMPARCLQCWALLFRACPHYALCAAAVTTIPQRVRRWAVVPGTRQPALVGLRVVSFVGIIAAASPKLTLSSIPQPQPAPLRMGASTT